MRAVRFHEYGPPEVLRIDEIDAPEPGPVQALVQVAAAGINYFEIQLRGGHLRRFDWYPQPELPLVPGIEVAGRVVAIGAEADPGLVGRRVAGSTTTGAGGYAELAVVSAADAIALPDDVSEATAVGLYAHGATALGVLGAARIQPGEPVLVEAAGGGIGSLLVQLAKRSGALVIAAASSAEKLAIATELGADIAVDYTQPDWADQVRTAVGTELRVVLETVGGTVAEQAFGLLEPVNGRMVIYGEASGQASHISPQDVFHREVALIPFSQRTTGMSQALITETFELAATGALRPVLGQVLPLADAVRAHAAFEARSAVGKTVLVP